MAAVLVGLLLIGIVIVQAGIVPQPNLLMGISSRPTTWGSDTVYNTTIVQQVIDFMNKHGLGIYRMCFDISADPTTYVQYYLTHCNYDLIINYYHNAFGTAITNAEWATSTAKALSLLNTFSIYQNRLWLEPCNERTNNDLPTQIQTFITTIRNVGYTCRIIVNRWYSQPWSGFASITDPLNKFWTGEHHYFNKESEPGDPVGETEDWAETKEQQALDLGLKLLDTEVGADGDEYPQFSQISVNAVSTYLQWCSDHHIGACVWMLHGTRNYPAKTGYPSYEGYGLKFPSNMFRLW